MYEPQSADEVTGEKVGTGKKNGQKGHNTQKTPRG